MVIALRCNERRKFAKGPLSSLGGGSLAHVAWGTCRRLAGSQNLLASRRSDQKNLGSRTESPSEENPREEGGQIGK